MQTNGAIAFVAFTGQRPTAALARAVSVATRSGTSLAVLLVTWEDGFEPPRGESDEAWYEAEIPKAVARSYHYRSGQLVHEAIEHARSSGARLIVLSDDIGGSGTCVAAIATAAGVPVLVARAPTSGDAIVVATDLSDPSYPVVQRAAEMLDRAETTLVGIHNIDDNVTSLELARRHAALAMALEPCAACHELVIDHAEDSASVVLAAARARDADLIVVGARRRSWLDILLHPTVASQVVDCAYRSVLIAPLGS